MSAKAHTHDAIRPEPRWLVIVAILAMGGLYYSLPERLTAGPSWLLPAILLLSVLLLSVSHSLRLVDFNFTVGIAVCSVMTAAVIWSLGALIAALPEKRQPPLELLRSAGALWISNVLVFAIWYWRLDAGGPHARDKRQEHIEGAFLFPQMTLPPDSVLRQERWKPEFIDYLFLAFNTSTAFSPTDAPVLSRWAKALMMVQSAVSLSTIAILAARAINIL
jgi:hypothetical protein